MSGKPFQSIEGLKYLRELYARIDREAESFLSKMNLQCPPFCGECCDTPSDHIEATVFEMLLPAIELWEKGEASVTLDRLEELGPETRCPFFTLFDEPGSGRCAIYPFRPLVCRLFGASGHRDKYNQLQYSPCRKLKKEIPAPEIANLIGPEVQAPVFSNFRQQLLGLNPLLAEKIYPLHTALHLALEKIGFFYLYA